jgi:small basic protein (TIGR04137 family)
MSLHKSLAMRSRLRRHRSVLSRAERIERLKREERWSEDRSVFGLPKVKVVRHMKAAKPKKEKAAALTEAAVAAPSAEAAAGKGAPAKAPASTADATKTETKKEAKKEGR